MNKISFGKGLVLSLIVCLIVIATIEILARQILPFPLGTHNTYASEPDVLYFHKPGSSGYEVAPHGDFKPSYIKYNEFGFRGESPENTTRPIVALMGDSFVEARQMEEKSTFTGILAESFKEYVFINAGCSAFTTTTEFLLLKNRVLRFKPSKVVLFFAFNDYADNFNYQGGYFRYPEIFTDPLPPASLRPNISQAPAPNTILNFLKAHSAIVANMAQWLSAQPKAELAILADRNLFQHSFKAVNTPTEKLNSEGLKVMDFTHRGLLEMATLAKESSIDFSVFIIPLPTQVSAKEWSSGKMSYYGYKPDEVDDSVVYQTRLLQFCKSNGIKCVDMLADFRAMSSSAPLFLPYDGHWTEAGHRLAASIVARHLFEAR